MNEGYNKGRRFLKGYVCGVLTVFVLIAVLGVLYRFVLNPNGLGIAESVKVLTKFNKLTDLVQTHYLEDVDPDILLDGAYKGFAEEIGDRYTRYYTREEYEDYLESISGSFAGIGVTVQWDAEEEMLRVVSVNEGGPAEEAGMHVDDWVYKVDGEVVKGLDSDSTISRIKGEEGTKVQISVLRDGEEIEMEITRARIEETTVAGRMLEDGVGYIALTGFNGTTEHQFIEAMGSLKEEGMQGLILDLRGNPGGRLDVVVNIADAVLPDGIITYTMTKSGEKTIFSSDAETILDVPLVVLVDENSASASEILAGAIRDYGVGTLVGTTTFGKGIVQTTYSLWDGSAFKTTMARYYTPNGDFIHEKGIAPDVTVSLPEGAVLSEIALTDQDTQFTEALSQLKELIKQE